MNIPNTSQATSFMVDKFKPVKIKGVDVVYADTPGRNKNVYPAQTLIDAADYYKKVVKLDPTHKYAFAKHPKDETEEWLGLIAAAVDDVYFEKSTNTLKADFTLLPTVWGHFIAWLIENDYHVGISLRGRAGTQVSAMNIAGKQVNVKIRSNLQLAGIDFVIYPSYIVTHASKENVTEQAASEGLGYFLPPAFKNEGSELSDVFESYMEKTSNEYGLSVDEIKTLFSTSNTTEQTVRRNTNMEPKTVEAREAQLLVDRLSVEQDKLEQKKVALEAEVLAVESQLETKKTETTELDTQITDKQKVIAGLSSLETRLAEKQANLEAAEKELEDIKTNLEATKAELEEMSAKSAEQMTVRIAGKTFTADNAPKLRVVPVDERTTNADYSTVKQSVLKQLVSLSGDEKVVEQTFALSGDVKNWEAMQFPVRQAFASEHEGYDIDLVVNRTALDSVTKALSGRDGLVLEKGQKATIVNFLDGEYTAMHDAGIMEKPESIVKAQENLAVLGKLRLDEGDEFIEAVIESAIMTGMVTVEVPEDNVSEQEGEEPTPSFLNVNRKIASDNLVSAILNTLMGINKGKVTENTNIDPEELDSFIAALTINPDGGPTELAAAFAIETAEDFQTNFIAPLQEAIDNQDMALALSMVQTAITTYTDAMAVHDDQTAPSVHITRAFATIAQYLVPQETEESTKETEDGLVPTNKVTEQQTEITEDDIVLLADLKQMFEQKFESVQIENEGDLKNVVEKLISDYESSFSELKNLQFAQLKAEKVSELTAAGVTAEVVDAGFEGIMSADELNAATETMLANAKAAPAAPVTESTKGDALDPVSGKSHAVVEPVPQVKVCSAFSKAMGSI